MPEVLIFALLLILCTVFFVLVPPCYSCIGVLLVYEYYYISYRLVSLSFASMYIWYLTANLTLSILYTYYFI